MRHRHFLKLSVCILILSSCTVGPEYRQPALDSGSEWTLETVADSQVDFIEWWKRFADPTLNNLVERAVSDNFDIRQAISRIEEVRALYNFTSATHFPTVDASGSVSRRRQSENGTLPISSIPGLDRDQTIYELGFDAIWEIDLFGGTRRALEAADARLDEAMELRRDIQLSITAELVRRYIELRSFQNELAVRQKIIETTRETYNLVRRQYEAGEVAAAQVAQADTRLKTQQAELPAIEAEIRTAALAIGLLLGNVPESELSLLDQQPQSFMLTAVPVGTRADLLRRRPDIRAAERRLAAATADIGIATAELFPKLTLSAAGGFEALSSGNLLQSSSQTGLFVPILSWRIFDGGRIRAQVKVQEEVARQSALGYEKAVLTALSEAEQALTRYHYGLLSIRRQDESVATAKINQDYAKTRYEMGDTSLLELLDAEQTVYEAETTYTRLHRVAATQLVSLYKTLGGGWKN
ncbi:MAG: efflux transporter outer membrane subunit [Desulforhopalus sp.]